MKGVTSLKVDGANCYLLYTEKRNLQDKVAIPFSKEMGQFVRNWKVQLHLPGIWDAMGLTWKGFGGRGVKKKTFFSAAEVGKGTLAKSGCF